MLKLLKKCACEKCECFSCELESQWVAYVDGEEAILHNQFKVALFDWPHSTVQSEQIQTLHQVIQIIKIVGFHTETSKKHRKIEKMDSKVVYNSIKSKYYFEACSSKLLQLFGL